MTTDTDALVRRAYRLAEGDVLDAHGFIDLFTEDGSGFATKTSIDYNARV